MNFKLILRLVIVIMGFVGNLTGFIIFSRKSLSKFLAHIVYRVLAVTCSLNLAYSIVDAFFKNDLIGDLYCQVIKYFYYVLAPISAWLLVYISIDRFITIKYINSNLLRKNNFQCLIVLIIIVCNLIIYTPITFLSTFQKVNNTNNTQQDSDCKEHKIIDIIDLISFTILPFITMTFFSCLLIYTINKSRKNILKITSIGTKNNVIKNIKFGITSILMDTSFILLNLPIILFNFEVEYEINLDLKDLFFNLFYLSSAINFYIIFFLNSIFRNELLKMIGLCNQNKVSKS
jgi:hypothetical protein